MPKIITVINQKGGVGKTTTAHALGAWLQNKQNKKVLFIDLDQQGNLTYATNASHSENNALGLLINAKLDKQAIQTTPTNYQIIPSSPMLANVESMLTMTGREYRLKEALSGLQGYDYIVMDTPPSLNILTINALTASNFALIPAQADIFSVQGITQLGQTIDAVKRYTNKNLQVLGIILTRYSNRNILSRDLQQVIEDTAKSIHTKTYTQNIREAIAIKEAQALRQDIFSYDAKGNATQDYGNLFQEIWQEIQ